MIAALFALSATTAQATAEVDLFLIANNAQPLDMLEWLDKGGPSSGIQTLLYTSLRALANQHRSFLVLDGLDTSHFAAVHKTVVLKRSYESFDSMAQTTVANGRPHTNVVETTTSAATERSELQSLPYAKQRGYQNITYAHFKSAKPWYIAFQDLNSYQSGLSENWRTNTTWARRRFGGIGRSAFTTTLSDRRESCCARTFRDSTE